MQDDRPARRHAGSLAGRVGLAAAVVGLLYVLRPGVVENGVRSPRVWAVVVLTVVVSRLVVLAVRRMTGRAIVASVAGNLVLVLIGAVLLAPSFQQRTADEPFPEMALPAADLVPQPPTTSPLTAAPPPSPPPSPPAPRAVAAGELDGVGHAAAGRAVLYAAGEQLVLRFEDVDIEGTPGPYVHLVPAGSRTPDGGLLLGKLTAERGTFAYTLPPGAVASGAWSVLVWCRPFRTPVAAADLVVI